MVWGEATKRARSQEHPTGEILDLFNKEQDRAVGAECSLVDYVILMAEHGRVPVILLEVRDESVTPGMVLVETRLVGPDTSSVVHTTWEAQA